MRSFQDRLSDFEKRGIKIAAISVDPPDVNRDHLANTGWTFPLLSDVPGEVVRRYDLLHSGGGQQGDISRPAEFLIDPSGTVRWLDLTEDYWRRARPETVLHKFDELKP